MRVCSLFPNLLVFLSLHNPVRSQNYLFTYYVVSVHDLSNISFSAYLAQRYIVTRPSDNQDVSYTVTV